MWILPTLSRPKQCRELLEQIGKLKCESPGVVFINGHNSAESYFGSEELKLPDDWTVYANEENIGALGALNKILNLYPNEPFYGFIGDDEFCKTKHFDRKLIYAAGDFGISHGHDNLHGGKRAQGYLCIGGPLARAVGYLAIPECWHWYGLDDMWEALAKARAISQIGLFDVEIEHRHPMAGALTDACYELGASRKDIDQQVYLHWLREKLAGTCERIQRAKIQWENHITS